MDHQNKNKEHKQLVAEMESGLKHVMLMAGTAQRLQGKVAIVTGAIKCTIPFLTISIPQKKTSKWRYYFNQLPYKHACLLV